MRKGERHAQRDRQRTVCLRRRGRSRDDARKSRAAFGRGSVGRGGRARPAAQRNDAGTDRRIGYVPRSARGLYLLQPRYFGKGLRGLCRSRLPPGNRDPRGSFSENRPCGKFSLSDEIISNSDL